MSRKLIALDLALLALLVWAGLGLRSIWMAAKLREAEELRKKPAPVAVSPLAPLPPSPAVVPSKYKEIADKFLLSKDRNPDVPVEPPPPPPPEKPMPPLPVYHGLMNLGDGPMAFLSKTAASPGPVFFVIRSRISRIRCGARFRWLEFSVCSMPDSTLCSVPGSRR